MLLRINVCNLRTRIAEIVHEMANTNCISAEFIWFFGGIYIKFEQYESNHYNFKLPLLRTLGMKCSRLCPSVRLEKNLEGNDHLKTFYS
jgi:hypothetical protein